MYHVLIIRSLKDAVPMEMALRSKGIEVSHYPLFNPQFFPIPPLNNPQALIVTSKNAIRALAGYDTLKQIPLYAVGDQTGEFAKHSGFFNVLSASGTSEELIQLIVKTERQGKGILWHLSGEHAQGNIIEALTLAGLEAKQQVVYRIEDAIELPQSLCREIKNHSISHVFFCSPRTTSLFINLLKKKRLAKNACHIISLCLSEDVKEKALGVNWRKVWISPRPSINDLMGYFDEEG